MLLKLTTYICRWHFRSGKPLPMGREMYLFQSIRRNFPFRVSPSFAALLGMFLIQALLWTLASGSDSTVHDQATKPVPEESVEQGAWKEPTRPRVPKNKLLLREGERITNQTGEFRGTGDGIVFHPQEGGTVNVLENLALERVAKVLQETRGRREWSVSGIITEYRGANFLLISRAALKARPSKDSSG